MWSHLSCKLLVKCCVWANPVAFPADWTGWETVKKQNKQNKPKKKKKKREQITLTENSTHWHICVPEKCLPIRCSIEILQLNRCWNTIYLHKWQVNSGRLCRGKEQHRFVSPTRAEFVQTGLNNVLTVQVPDKLARETRCKCGKTDVRNLLWSASPPSVSIIPHF